MQKKHKAHKNRSRLSKFMAKVLRHQPQLIGLNLDQEGWCDLDELVNKMIEFGNMVTRKQIEEVVELDNKQRYIIENGKIRANQGHSIKNVQINFSQIEPPEYLYHGTAHRFVEQILQKGLLPMKRQHVHLSKDEQTAHNVGKRRDPNPVILKILAQKAHQDGEVFYISQNQVYLTHKVLPKHIEEPK